MKFKRVPSMPDGFSAVGFGCWALGGGQIWNQSSDADSVLAVQRALDLDINFFDVAPVYGFGHAEEVLGRALAGRRQQVLIGTKCGLVWDGQGRITNDLSPDNVRREIDESLRRLQTDHVDIYQLHWPDPATPIEETMMVMAELQRAGKIRYIGVTNFSLAELERARTVAPVASLQGLYNLLERNPRSYHDIPLEYRTEREVLPYCQEHGLAFFPYSPLFQGLLTGTFRESGNFDERDVRAANPKLSGDLFLAYFEIVEELVEFARDIGRPLSQVAINWLINQDAVTSVICGAQNVQHVEQNVGSVSWELTPDMMARIDLILQPHSQLVQGEAAPAGR